MTSPIFRFLMVPCFLAACASPGGSPSPDASTSTRDTTPAPDCVSSASRFCTASDAAVNTPAVADAAADGTDTVSSAPAPDVAPDLPVDSADTAGPETADATGPETKTPDVASRKEDAAVPDALPPDAALPKADTRLADVVSPGADTVAPDSKAGAACAQEPFVHLSPSELKSLLDGGEDPFLINVKGSSIKNIPGTDAVLASDVPGIEALVKNDVCANIVLYCRSGGTSQTVGSQLITKGYRRVRDLAGGITAWEAAGYPTE